MRGPVEAVAVVLVLLQLSKPHDRVNDAKATFLIGGVNAQFQQCAVHGVVYVALDRVFADRGDYEGFWHRSLAHRL
jgi:hypothetical protein